MLWGECCPPPKGMSYSSAHQNVASRPHVETPSVKMRSYWERVRPYPPGLVSLGEGGRGTQRGGRDGDQSDAREGRGCQRLEEATKDPPLEPSRECGPTYSLDSSSGLQNCEEMHACLLLKPPSVRCCYGSPGKGHAGHPGCCRRLRSLGRGTDWGLNQPGAK